MFIFYQVVHYRIFKILHELVKPAKAKVILYISLILVKALNLEILCIIAPIILQLPFAILCCAFDRILRLTQMEHKFCFHCGLCSLIMLPVDEELLRQHDIIERP